MQKICDEQMNESYSFLQILLNIKLLNILFKFNHLSGDQIFTLRKALLEHRFKYLQAIIMCFVNITAAFISTDRML